MCHLIFQYANLYFNFLACAPLIFETNQICLHDLYDTLQDCRNLLFKGVNNIIESIPHTSHIHIAAWGLSHQASPYLFCKEWTWGSEFHQKQQPIFSLLHSLTHQIHLKPEKIKYGFIRVLSIEIGE